MCEARDAYDRAPHECSYRDNIIGWWRLCGWNRGPFRFLTVRPPVSFSVVKWRWSARFVPIVGDLGRPFWRF